jgi:hypothetical protein
MKELESGVGAASTTPHRQIPPPDNWTPLLGDVRVCPSGWGADKGRTCPLGGLWGATLFPRACVAACRRVRRRDAVMDGQLAGVGAKPSSITTTTSA